jgi:hypothetical protein
MNKSKDLLPSAIQLAKMSDLAVVVVGDSQDTCQEAWGGRTGDRADLVIPKHRYLTFLGPPRRSVRPY